MSAPAHDINDEFGVGFEFDPAEAAFLPSEPMPHFFTDRENHALVEGAAGGIAPSGKKAQSVNLYPPMLLMDLAMGIDDSDTICERHDLTPEELGHLFTLLPFKRELSAMVRDLRTENKIFQARAGVVAMNALARVNEVIDDVETPAKDVIAGAKLVIEAANLMPKAEKSGDSGPTQAVQININIPNYT